MAKLLTKKEIDRRLELKNISVISEFKNTTSKPLFRHKFCGYEWMATLDNVLRLSGCPKCAGNIKLSNTIIDDRLKGTRRKRIGDYVNIDTPIDFKCLDCEDIRN